jgi:7-cyano-7-deazaguanine synthase
VLVSGGVDSVVLLGELLDQGREVHPIYVRSGFRWEKAELHWIRRILKTIDGHRLKPLTVLRVPAAPVIDQGHWSLSGRGVPSARAAWDSVYLPGRNLVLLSEAGVLCAERGVGALALAVLKGNPFSDATPKFFAIMSRAITQATGSPLIVMAPYRALTKLQVVCRGRSLDLPLELTFSCINPRGLKPCGKCSKCGERDEALRLH